MVPKESCELSPQKICTDVVKQYPTLVMDTNCQILPREICSPERVQPKEVTRPFIKKVCTPHLEVSLLANCDFANFSQFLFSQKKDIYLRILDEKNIPIINAFVNEIRLNDSKIRLRKYSNLEGEVLLGTFPTTETIRGTVEAGGYQTLNFKAPIYDLVLDGTNIIKVKMKPIITRISKLGLFGF